jgi:phage I-like protein
VKLIWQPHHRNSTLAEGEQIVAPGEDFTVSDERGRELLAALYPEIKEAGDALTDLSRSELNALALAAGVTAPKRLRSKQAVIDQITSASG